MAPTTGLTLTVPDPGSGTDRRWEQIGTGIATSFHRLGLSFTDPDGHRAGYSAEFTADGASLCPTSRGTFDHFSAAGDEPALTPALAAHLDRDGVVALLRHDLTELLKLRRQAPHVTFLTAGVEAAQLLLAAYALDSRSARQTALRLLQSGFAGTPQDLAAVAAAALTPSVGTLP